MKILELLARHGDIKNVTKIKHVRGGVWQINEDKSFLARLYGFTWRGVHIITHGGEKQSDPSDQYERTRQKKRLWEKEHP